MGRPLHGVRILHVHTLPVVSGSGINTFLTMEGSRRCGADVALAAAPGGRLEDQVRQAGMGFFPIRNFVSELSPFKDLHALSQLLRLLAREKFDIVHTHNSKAGFLGRMAARRNRIPIVIHTIHGFAFHEEESWLRRRMFVNLERLAAHWCDQMIAISQPMMLWAQQEGIAAAEKLVKIYSGIPVERFRSRLPSRKLQTRFGLEPDDVVIGVVSKLWEGKGHTILLEAVAHLVRQGLPVKLLVVGEGHLEDKLKAKVRELKIEERVIFTGFLEDVSEVTAILDISALPSFYEGMGRVVLEAMAAGKPVVASNVGGLTELVENEVTGYLIPPGDVGALADRLERLANDPDKRKEMGDRGSRRVRREHSAEKMVEMIHQVYRDHLDGCKVRAYPQSRTPWLDRTESKTGTQN